MAGRDVEELAREVETLFAGNASWRRYMSPYSLTSPDVLLGSGIIQGDGTVEVEYQASDGTMHRAPLAPLPLDRSTQPNENWWFLAPEHAPAGGPWSFALDASSAPRYLRRTREQYWSEYLSRDRLLYLQYNRAGDAAGREPLAAFGERVLREIATRRLEAIVVDLRFNTGGNLDVARGLMDRLAAAAKARAIPVFAITGRATFSAGLFHAMQLRQRAAARIVGEAPGDSLDFWAEGGNAITPNGKLALHYADRFHSYSRAPRPDALPYLERNSDLDLESEQPDVLVPMAFRDYLAGRDAAMEAILGALRASRSSPPPPPP
jgi:hypothetical protein